MKTIDITGLDKAEVLAALYNCSQPLGLGFLHFDPKPMSTAQAKLLLSEQSYFDYVQGRVMKVDLKSDTELKPWLYDRDNGEGAAARAINTLRKELKDEKGVNWKKKV